MSPLFWTVLTALAFAALPSDALNDNAPCVNGPLTRSCWEPGFDIHTDYTALIAPEGKVVEYDLTVSQVTIAPDGYEKLAMLVNGQVPGPTIEANWGDTLRITVHNNFTENHNGSSIHWHGIRQHHTNWQDGVPGVTQCPVKPGSSQLYEFKLTQYGTTWYHGHLSMQYTNGLYGPLIIHGPSSANWDEDLGPWLVGDWYHDDVFGLIQVGETTNSQALPQVNLLNGKSKFDCDPASDPRCTGTGGEWFEVLFHEGTTYKLNIINSGTLFTYNFWIDGHDITVLSTDFVPIEPYKTNILNVGIGQRYEIIIKANATFENGTNFWIHAQHCLFPDALDWRAGIIRYDASNTSDPYTPPAGPELDAYRHLDFGCADFDIPDITPIVPQQVGTSTNEVTSADYMRIGLVNATWPDLDKNSPPLFLWVLENTPLFANWSQPTLKTIALENGSVSDLPDYAVPLELDYPTGSWVYLVITTNYTDADVAAADDTPRVDIGSVHPMHLHGHDFVILAQGAAPFDPMTVKPKLDNPPRRDVLSLPPGAFAWLAFQVDNPGSWLFHCHIAWHASDGLALQYVEQPGQIQGLMQEAGALGPLRDQCKEFDTFYNTVNIPANATVNDSGV